MKRKLQINILYKYGCKNPPQKYQKVNSATYKKNYTWWASGIYSRSVKSESPSVVSNYLWPHGLYSPWNSPGRNTGLGSLSLLHEMVPTQGSNPDVLHCTWILYQLSHKGSPRILEWVAYPFSSRYKRYRLKVQSSAQVLELIMILFKKHTLLLVCTCAHLHPSHNKFYPDSSLTFNPNSILNPTVPCPYLTLHWCSLPPSSQLAEATTWLFWIRRLQHIYTPLIHTNTLQSTHTPLCTYTHTL